MLIRNMAGEVVGEVPDTPGEAVAQQEAVAADIRSVLTAAEHLADVAERRSPTKALTEAIRRYRDAVERMEHPVRDIRPGADGFLPRSVASRLHEGRVW